MKREAGASNVYRPDEVFPPGETLAELMDHRHMSQADLAKRTGLSPKHVNQILKGTASISSTTALLLEKATNVPAGTWITLEAAFREHKSREEEEARFAEDVDWLDQLPVKQLIQRGFLRKTSNQVDLVRQLCEFFGVANREIWETVWQKPTAYRRSRAFASDPGAVAAWLRIGEMCAAEIECAPFDRRKLEDLVHDLRGLTCEPDSRKWWPSLVEKCADAGVAVVKEPEIKGARINGAARWLSSTKALIQLSLRHRWNDIFWFTFFHELGHLLIHSKKDTFINDKGRHSGVEQEADAFASQTLIPPRHDADLAELRTLEDVENFAARVGIAPGIVVGRLQHEERWPYSKGNALKQQLDFATS